jgi:hypothetical protein
MKKLAVVAIATGLMMAMAGPASAGRVVWEPYGPVPGVCVGAPPLDTLDRCISFAVQSGEGSVTVTIVDDSGLPTYGLIGQDYNDDGLADASMSFCGTVTFPLMDSVPLGVAEVVVTLGEVLPVDWGGWPSPCGTATSGIVIAEFG